MRVTIRDPRLNLFVIGINQQHQCVTLSPHAARARKFPSPRAAQRWLNRYADAGYGLRSTTPYAIEVAP